MERATSKSQWKKGQEASGLYVGNKFKGRISGETRPTPDSKNIMFMVDLDSPITIYGVKRMNVCILTNSDDELYLH
jgi:hypothetical protein